MKIYDYNDFPKSTEAPEGMKILAPKHFAFSVFEQKAEKIKNDITKEVVVYSRLSGEEQKIIIYRQSNHNTKLPLVVYVPGSGWERQNDDEKRVYLQLLAGKGYVAVAAYYRPSEVEKFPAQVTDIKNAIKFLVKNADKFNIDTDKIAVMGDSSGGHVASFIGITGENAPIDKNYDCDVSFDVKCVVDWFGPSDIFYMNDYPCCFDFSLPDSFTGKLIGGKPVYENKADADKASPINYISKDSKISPILIMHGNKDAIVPFNQSVRLYEKLKDVNADVTFYCVDGAGHWENGFNSIETVGTTFEFLSRILKV